MKFVPRVLGPEAADVSRGHDRSPLRELCILLLAVGGIVLGFFLGYGLPSSVYRWVC